MKVRRIECDFDSRNGLAAEAAVPEPESSTEAAAMNEGGLEGFGGFGGSVKP